MTDTPVVHKVLSVEEAIEALSNLDPGYKIGCKIVGVSKRSNSDIMEWTISKDIED